MEEEATDESKEDLDQIINDFLDGKSEAVNQMRNQMKFHLKQ